MHFLTPTLLRFLPAGLNPVSTCCFSSNSLPVIAALDTSNCNRSLSVASCRTNDSEVYKDLPVSIWKIVEFYDACSGAGGLA